jgi:Tfp pilus assembly protein PilZ
VCAANPTLSRPLTQRGQGLHLGMFVWVASSRVSGKRGGVGVKVRRVENCVEFSDEG